MKRHPLLPTCAALFLALGTLCGCAFLGREMTIVYLSVNSGLTAKAIEIEINRSFIERYKDRIIIHATFTVDKAMQNPIARMFDGDLHCAGRAPEIALPVVAEVANAASEKDATDLIHSAEGTHRPLRISGVWRIWPEHAGDEKAEQGKPLPEAESENPNHVFEIHPVTRINDVGLLGSFKSVEGFMPGDARATFESYEKVECTITPRPQTISIVTRKGLYNDVEFLMEIADEPQVETPEGRFVIASALDLKGSMVVERLRMVFAKGTPPEIAVRSLKRGDRLHVCGLPRVNFAEVARRAAGGQADPSLLVKPLPYEIIIVGVYPDAKKEK